MLRRFGEVLSRSSALSVIGESMQSAYAARYGKKGVILRHGIQDKYFLPWNDSYTSSGELTLCFAGTLYAKEEWNALLRALDSVGWRVLDRDIKIRFIGVPPRFGAVKCDRVSYVGRLSFEDTIAEVASCQIAYLPYWFAKRQRVAAETSFPGKLSTYAASGIPVLFHGPTYASVPPFLARFPFGTCCHSLTPSVILRALEHIIADKQFHAGASDARRAAYFEELNLTTMLQRFGELTGSTAVQSNPD